MCCQYGFNILFLSFFSFRTENFKNSELELTTASQARTSAGGGRQGGGRVARSTMGILREDREVGIDTSAASGAGARGRSGFVPHFNVYRIEPEPVFHLDHDTASFTLPSDHEDGMFRRKGPSIIEVEDVSMNVYQCIAVLSYLDSKMPTKEATLSAPLKQFLPPQGR